MPKTRVRKKAKPHKISRKKITLRTRPRRSTKSRHIAFSLWRIGVKLLLWSGMLGLFALMIWMWRLDQRLQAEFNEPFKSVPAHLYARPYSVQIGDATSIQEIKNVLLKYGYHHAAKIAKPGDFAVNEKQMDVYRKIDTLNAQPQAVRIFVSNGRVQLLTEHASGQTLGRFELSSRLVGNLITGPIEDRILLELHDVPTLLLDALITMEDRRFASHYGIDPLGIMRAVVQNIRDGRVSQGGSTLTQQLVKNLYLDNSRTLKRKINEALMALIIEWRYDKAQILSRYINTIFLGQSGNRAIHGFGLAARFYFDRELVDLSPAQIAMMVGMIPAPSAYNPFRNIKRATLRRNLVLDTLHANGYISAGEVRLHKQTPLGVTQAKHKNEGRYGAFTDLLNRQLSERYDRSFMRSGGMNVYSTLDESIQSKAQKQLELALAGLEIKHNFKKESLQGAMVIVERKSGEILSLIGSRNGQKGNYNRALDARRPIGSLVKPAVYLTALLNPERYSTMSFINDEPLRINLPNGEDWQPGNYDKQYHGRVSLHDALVNSYNIPAVKVGMDIGLDAVTTTLQRLGVETPILPYPSMLLGATNLNLIQVAQMFQTLSNNGELQSLTTLRAVASDDNHVLANYQSQGQQMINAKVSFLLANLLEDVAKIGTAQALSHLLPGVRLAGKTGTTNDYRDSWFAGFGDNYLAVTWVGHDDNSTTGLTGSSGALRVWAKVMASLDIRSLTTSTPMGVSPVEVDLSNGQLAVSGCSQNSAMRYFISGYEPISNQDCESLDDKLGDWLQRWFRSTPNTPQKSETKRRKRMNEKQPETER